MIPVRIATYNLELGGTGREEAILAVLTALKADLISLTEADDPDLVAALAAKLDLHHVWAEGSGDRHIATLSRYPIRTWQAYNRPPLTQAVLYTLVDTPAGPLSLYNVHFLPYLLLPFEIRRWQAIGRLLDLVKTAKPGPHLILGDLNAIGPGDRVLQRNNPGRMKRVMLLQLRLILRLAIPRLLRAGYVDCYRHCHPREDGFTWWTKNPTTRYDYIMAERSLVSYLRDCQIADNIEGVTLASDHFPLFADFDFAPS